MYKNTSTTYSPFYAVFKMKVKPRNSRYNSVGPQAYFSSTVIPPYFADFGMKKSGLKNREIGGTAK